MRTMKQAVWAMVVGVTVGAGAQTSAAPVRDDLFAGTEKFAQGASSVTQIDMDPSELGKVDGKDGLKARRTVLSVVHTYAYDRPGMYRMEDLEVFRRKLDTGDWHCSVRVRDMKRGEATDVCSKRRDDGMREEAIITAEPKSLTFIHTIRKMGAPGGMSGLVLPAVSPETRAEMAAMQAQMAIMKPELEELKAPDPEQMRRMQKDLKRLDGLKLTPEAPQAK